MSDQRLHRHDSSKNVATAEPGEEAAHAWRKPGSGPVVQRKQAGAADPTTELPADGSGAPLPQALQDKMEAAFGTSFAAVRVHEGGRSEALGARAYTQGMDLHFAPGEYQPGTESGQELIGHELAHVVQQSQGRVSETTQAKGVGLNADAGLEREADELGAKAARGEKVSGGNSGTALSSGKVIQRKERQEGDLDYGSSGPRKKAMKEVDDRGDDHRGAVSPTVDVLNAEGGITPYMTAFRFHDLLDYITNYSETVVAQVDEKDKHVVAWVLYLQANIDKVDLSKQVDAATSGIVPTEATKDRLQKNRHGTLGAPQPATIRTWYDTQVEPVNVDEKERLEEWVWNAFFRCTSKLGIDFTSDQGKTIHFNVSRDVAEKALDGRDPGARHGKNAITHSELRHLKKLQDRGEAPDVSFEDNTGGTHDVVSPFKSLDMLNAAGILRMYQTPEWRKESVDFETRLGSYLAGKAEASAAVQGGLSRMDSVLAKDDKNHGKTAQQKRRQVFGQTKPDSAGQVGEDPDTIRSVIKGEKQPGHDDINMREQMTAFYNAGLWNGSRGKTIKKTLTEVGQIEDKSARKDAAAVIGISEAQIDAIHEIIRKQIQATHDKIDAIAAKPRGERLAKAKVDLELEDLKAAELVAAIHELHKERRAVAREVDLLQKAALGKTFAGNKWELAKTFTKVNILETDIDSDDSRDARSKRDNVDRLAHQKSSQDYTDMGVPLSDREKTSSGGVLDEAAKLPWVEGMAYYKIDETTGWGKEMKDKGLPTVAGNSGTTARLMSIYVWLEAGAPLDFRMALMGWMLPCRDHSLKEIMEGAKSAGVKGPGENLDNPVKMYRNIAPLTEGELRTNAGEGDLFPEERVLRTVSEPTYKSLIKQT